MPSTRRTGTPQPWGSRPEGDVVRFHQRASKKKKKKTCFRKFSPSIFGFFFSTLLSTRDIIALSLSCRYAYAVVEDSLVCLSYILYCTYLYLYIPYISQHKIDIYVKCKSYNFKFHHSSYTYTYMLSMIYRKKNTYINTTLSNDTTSWYIHTSSLLPLLPTYIPQSQIRLQQPPSFGLLSSISYHM